MDIIKAPAFYSKKYLDKIYILNKKYGRKNKRKVKEVYGSIPLKSMGSGRHSKELPNINLNVLKDYIEFSSNYDIKFNYVINSNCLKNIEHKTKTFHEFLKFIGKLYDIGVDKFTVAHPKLIDTIKHLYPDVKLVISTISNIDSLSKVEYYYNIGIDEITLPISHQRDFDMIEAITSEIPIEIITIPNTGCIQFCPSEYAHYHFTSSSSFKFSDITSFMYIGKCYLEKLKYPSLLFKIPWIRPEDLRIYSKFNIHHFKLSGRTIVWENKIINVIKTYLEGNYNGNMFDIMTSDNSIINTVFFVENKLLNNFLRFFVEKRPKCYLGCKKCNFCERISRKFLIINKKLRKKYISILTQEYEKIIEKITKI